MLGIGGVVLRSEEELMRFVVFAPVSFSLNNPGLSKSYYSPSIIEHFVKKAFLKRLFGNSLQMLMSAYAEKAFDECLLQGRPFLASNSVRRTCLQDFFLCAFE